MQVAGGFGLNDYLTLAAGRSPVVRFQPSGAELRLQALRKTAQDGTETVEPSGARSARAAGALASAQASEARRLRGAEQGRSPMPERGRASGSASANDDRLLALTRPALLAALLPPRPALDALDFVRLQEQQGGRALPPLPRPAGANLYPPVPQASPASSFAARAFLLYADASRIGQPQVLDLAA